MNYLCIFASAFDFNAVLTQVKDFCSQYGFYIAIGAAAVFLLWIITWISLGVKCRRLKKQVKRLSADNAVYIAAAEARENEEARSAAYSRTDGAQSAATVVPELERQGASEYEPVTSSAMSADDDDDIEEFDISADDDTDTVAADAAPEVKPESVKYVVKFDRAKLSWIITKKGSQRVVRRVQTKEEAVRIARELCKKTGAGLYVYKKNGRFQKI